MFTLSLTDSPRLAARDRRGRNYVWATDGSLPNPLEATLAAVAGCAGVFAQKACHAQGVSAEGIEIGVRPRSQPGNPLAITAIEIDVLLPAALDTAQRAAVLASVEDCPVKAMLQAGDALSLRVNPR